MIRIFKTDFICSQMPDFQLTKLINDFRKYKETGIPAYNFGRDVLYNDPDGIPSVRIQKLQHLHLLSNRDTHEERQLNRTSDDHLVYCQGFYNSDAYLLIALLSPDAHNKARNKDVMLKMVKLSEKFRHKY